jgi:uncharacterized spore protein YtfJ
MAESYDRVAAMAVESQDKTAQLFERLMEVAQPKSVYSEPVVSGEFTLINASEVSTGIGVGFGLGGGEGTSPGDAEKQNPAGQGSGVGGGGGGGGGSMARPVAVVIIGPQGVRVEPVVDVTKLGLAMFMTVGSMLMMFSRMRRLMR